MKLSKTGKPLCARCRRLATHRMSALSRANGYVERIYVYHCDEHKTRYDKPLAGELQHEE